MSYSEAGPPRGGGRGGNLPQGLRYSGAPNARSQCSNGPGWGPLPDRYAPGLNLSLGGPAQKEQEAVVLKVINNSLDEDERDWYRGGFLDSWS